MSALYNLQSNLVNGEIHVILC